MTIESFHTPASARQRGWHSAQKETSKRDDVSFDHLLDALNPLNHVPMADELEFSSSQADENPLLPPVRMLGSALLGGVLGFTFSAFDAVFREEKGEGLASVVYRDVMGEEKTQLAQQESESVSRQYASVANAHKRHLHTWSA